MTYLLDTDTCIECLRLNQPVVEKLQSIDPEEIGVSVISYFELIFGAHKGTRPDGVALVDEFVDQFSVVKMDRDIAEEYAQIRLQLQFAGTPIGGNDLLLAAHARYLDLTLVTSNLREFQRVKGLKTESWKRRS